MPLVQYPLIYTSYFNNKIIICYLARLQTVLNNSTLNFISWKLNLKIHKKCISILKAWYEMQKGQSIFVLSPHSHQSRTLTSDQLGSEVLLLLESFKSRIDAKDGPGSFIHYSPWRDMVD